MSTTLSDESRRMKRETYNSADHRFSERFRTVIERIGTLEKAGSLIDTTGEQVGRWRDEKAKAPFLAIAILADAAKVSLEWLAFGREPSGAAVPESAGIAANDAENDNVAYVEQLDVVASAGPGFENVRPYQIDLLPFPKSWLERLGVPEKHARFIDCRGDSMEPTILDGAIVLVDTRFQQTRGDGIYVLLDGPNVRIKRIAIGWEGKIVLLSDNERYGPETLAAPDAEALRIAGKVVWAGGEI